jgi:hypothetical protein
MDSLPIEMLTTILDFCSPLPKLRLVCIGWRDAIDTHFDHGSRDFNNPKLMGMLFHGVSMKQIIQKNYHDYMVRLAVHNDLYTAENAKILHIAEISERGIRFGNQSVDIRKSNENSYKLWFSYDYGWVTSRTVHFHTNTKKLCDILLSVLDHGIFSGIIVDTARLLGFWKLICLCMMPFL